MARSIRRRRKQQRIYWMEIGFLLLGLIALRPSLVTDLASMGRLNSERDRTQSQVRFPINDSEMVGLSSYYPNWNASSPHTPFSYPNPSYDPRLGQWNTYRPPNAVVTLPASNAAWPNAQMHQWVHNGDAMPVAPPLMASPAWNNNVPTGRY